MILHFCDHIVELLSSPGILNKNRKDTEEDIFNAIDCGCYS